MAQSEEDLPWYRGKGFKGNLTENEKRLLDSFRIDNKHPCTSNANIPEDVHALLIRLVVERQEDKLGSFSGKYTAIIGIAAFVIYLWYIDYLEISTSSLVVGGAGVVCLCVLYSFEYKKYSKILNIREEIKKEWELKYIEELRIEQSEKESA